MYLNSFRTPANVRPSFRYVTLDGNLTQRNIAPSRIALEISHIFQNVPAVTSEFAANARIWLGRDLTPEETSKVDDNHSVVYTNFVNVLQQVDPSLRQVLHANMIDTNPEFNALNEIVAAGSSQASIDLILNRQAVEATTSDKEPLETAVELQKQAENESITSMVSDAISAQESGSLVPDTASIRTSLTQITTNAPTTISSAENQSEGSTISRISSQRSEVIGSESGSEGSEYTIGSAGHSATSLQREILRSNIPDFISLIENNPEEFANRVLSEDPENLSPQERSYLTNPAIHRLRTLRVERRLEAINKIMDARGKGFSIEDPEGGEDIYIDYESLPFYGKSNPDQPRTLEFKEPLEASSSSSSSDSSVGPSASHSDETSSAFGGHIPVSVDEEPVGATIANTNPNQVITGPMEYTGKGAIYHREAVTVFFNDADHPKWDEELNGFIDKANYTKEMASEIIKNIVFTEGPKILVLAPKTNGSIQELKEILQLYFSMRRGMSRGPRIPVVGISLGSLLAQNPLTSDQKTLTGTAGPIKTITPPVPKPVNLAKAWDNKAYGLGGAGHSHGPTVTQNTFAIKEATKIRMYQETGPGLMEPLPRGVMLLPVNLSPDPCGKLIDYSSR